MKETKEANVIYDFNSGQIRHFRETNPSGAYGVHIEHHWVIAPVNTTFGQDLVLLDHIVLQTAFSEGFEMVITRCTQTQGEIIDREYTLKCNQRNTCFPYSIEYSSLRCASKSELEQANQLIKKMLSAVPPFDKLYD